MEKPSGNWLQTDPAPHHKIWVPPTTAGALIPITLPGPARTQASLLCSEHSAENHPPEQPPGMTEAWERTPSPRPRGFQRAITRGSCR